MSDVGDQLHIETVSDNVFQVSDCAFVVAKLNGIGGFLAWLPYSRRFVNEIKEALPAPDRVWVKHMRAWWVAPESREPFAELVKRHFGVDLAALAETRGDMNAEEAA